ncbi:MAG: hypothetical protein KGJ60_12745 [Verrucomicrobiota bacterium]|nr:hypothetical protein [Verrucomicrobiota bacterium]
MKKLAVLSLLTVGFMHVNQSRAAALYSTDFNNLANGDLVGQDNWAAYSAAALTPVQISGGEISLAQGSGSREDVERDLGATMGSGDTWFYSFDVAVTGDSSTNYFAMLWQNTTTFDARLFVAPTTEGDFTFGIGSGSTVGAEWNSALTFGTTHKVVVGYDFDSTDVTLWVDPASGTSPSVTYTGGSSHPVTAIAFRQATGSSATETIDNLAVGTSFNDVTAAPEPSALALAGAGSLLVWSLHRRRQINF